MGAASVPPPKSFLDDESFAMTEAPGMVSAVTQMPTLAAPDLLSLSAFMGGGGGGGAQQKKPTTAAERFRARAGGGAGVGGFRQPLEFF